METDDTSHPEAEDEPQHEDDDEDEEMREEEMREEEEMEQPDDNNNETDSDDDQTVSDDDEDCLYVIELDTQSCTFEDLCKFLTDDNNSNVPMSKKFDCLLEWLKHNIKLTESGFDVLHLLMLIDFTCVPTEIVIEGFKDIKNLCRDSNLTEFMVHVMTYHASHFTQPCLTEEKHPHSRVDMDEKVVIVGGMRCTDTGQPIIQSAIQYFDVDKKKKWRKLTNLQEPLFGHSVAVLNNFLYIAGGCNYQTYNHPQIISEVHRYDVKLDKWMLIAPMQEKRCLFTLSALDGKLYAVGGRTPRVWSLPSSPDVLSRTVESYDPATNSWTYVAPINISVYMHASVACRGKLFISGGCHDVCQDKVGLSLLGQIYECMNKMSSYCPNTNTWQSLPPLPSGERVLHTMCVLNDSIYIIGGRNNKKDIVTTMDCFQLTTETWMSVAPSMRTEKLACTAVAVDGDQLYICGGIEKEYTGSGHVYMYNSTVDCYNATTNTWKKMGKLSHQIIPTGCTLKIPKWKKSQGVQCMSTDQQNDVKPVLTSTDCIAAESIQTEQRFQMYCQKILDGVRVLQDSDQDSDITIIVDGERFSGHKVILVTFSDFFKAMFTGGMKESKQTHIKQEIELQGVSVEGLKSVLQFMYSGHVCLNHANFDSVLNAASYLQVATLLQFCTDYLKGETREDNFKEFVALATTYGLLERFATSQKVIDHFVTMATKYDGGSGLSDLTTEQLLVFLQSVFIADYQPVQIFCILNEWVKHHEEVKIDDIKRLLSCVSFGLISSEDLVQVVAPSELVSKFTEHAHKSLLDALEYHAVPHLQHMTRSSLADIDTLNTEEVIVATGGLVTTAERIQKLSYFDEVTNKWYDITDMPFERLAYHTAVMDNYLYIAGGENHNCSDMDPSGCQFTVHTVYRYDILHNRWDTIASMQELRTDFCLAAIQGKLYAVGGRNGYHITGINSVECYDPSTNSWSYVASLPMSLFAMAGVAYKDKLYITGGCYFHADLLYSNALIYYDPAINQWGELSAMSAAHPIGWHSMVVAGDKLYVLGGQEVELQTYENTSSFELRCYDPKTDQWSKSPSMPSDNIEDKSVTIAAYRSVYKDDKIYCINGDMIEDSFIVRKKVRCFDMKQDKWISTPDLPTDGYQALLTVKIPVYKLKQYREKFHQKQRNELTMESSSQINSPQPSLEGECEVDLTQDSERTFTNVNHAQELLEGMYSLYTEGLLCDTTLMTPSMNIPIHGILLTLLNSAPTVEERKPGHEELELYEAPSSYVKALVKILYTGKLPCGFDCTSVTEFKTAAQKLNLTTVIDIFCDNTVD